MLIKYKLLDPRPTELDAALHQVQQWKDDGFYVVGFEVTVPTLNTVLDLNIDPQHIGGDAAMCCVQWVYKRIWMNDLRTILPVGLDKLILCTVRADMDAVGAMVLVEAAHTLSITALDEYLGDLYVEERINQVHNADCFASTKAWAPRELFTEGFEQKNLAAIARATSDFKVDFTTRVGWVRQWLLTGEEPDGGYRAVYEVDCAAVKTALDNGDAQVNVDGNIAVVVSTLRANTTIGYTQAPIVIALNPAFPSQEGDYTRYTICQYALGYCDMKAILAELNTLESGWGGSPTIGGSPQGQSSTLSIDDVVVVVKKHTIAPIAH
jgi:hypothetical protein